MYVSMNVRIRACNTHLCMHTAQLHTYNYMNDFIKECLYACMCVFNRYFVCLKGIRMHNVCMLVAVQN